MLLTSKGGKHLFFRRKTILVPFCIWRGQRSKFLNFDTFLSLKIVFILSNSEDPDEMSHYLVTNKLNTEFLVLCFIWSSFLVTSVRWSPMWR